MNGCNAACTKVTYTFAKHLYWLHATGWSTTVWRWFHRSDFDTIQLHFQGFHQLHQNNFNGTCLSPCDNHENLQAPPESYLANTGVLTHMCLWWVLINELAFAEKLCLTTHPTQHLHFPRTLAQGLPAIAHSSAQVPASAILNFRSNILQKRLCQQKLEPYYYKGW